MRKGGSLPGRPPRWASPWTRRSSPWRPGTWRGAARRRSGRGWSGEASRSPSSGLTDSFSHRADAGSEKTGGSGILRRPDPIEWVGARRKCVNEATGEARRSDRRRIALDERKIIAVVGATGAQGGGLCRAILKEVGGGYGVRALTRNAGSGKAEELRKLGAEVVEVDIDDAESLKRAFRGAHGAYCVTFFWEHFSPERELAEAKNMADAAKHAGVRHVIWSTLEDTRKRVPLDDPRMPTLMGKYKVPHLDAKGEANRFFSESGLPTTFLLTSFYWENLIHFGMGPKRGEDGILYFTLPMGDKKLPGIASGDIGKCAYAIFRKGGEFIGRTVGIAGGHLTGVQMAAALAKALGEEVRYNSVSPETYRGFGFPGAEDLGNMFQFKRDFESDFCGARSLRFSRELNPSMRTFEEWLAEHGDRIPIEKGSRRAAGE